MTARTVLVTGASGTVGRELVPLLRTAGVQVRALSRDPDSAELPPDVEAVRGDLYEPASLERALAGVDAVFLLWPAYEPEGADAAVAAIARRAARVVYLSSESAEPGSVWATLEAHLAASGVEWTFLRPTGFAKNSLGWADAIATGEVAWAFGRAARSLIDERDIAAVAARALTEPGHAGRTYVLSGPEALTQEEQVRIIGEAIGRPLRWRELDRPAARRALVPIFESEAMADAALDTWERFVAEPETVTDTVEELTGQPARSFAAWAADRAELFRAAEPA